MTTIIEHPILFSGPMVRAIMQATGPKTQTRRILMPQPVVLGERGTHWSCPSWPKLSVDGLEDLAGYCPYGKPGHHLWVRETWAVYGQSKTGPVYEYRATCERVAPRWRPSIHMPRAASRLTLEVLKVRVERLQDISDTDICAEMGVPGPEVEGPYERNYRESFKTLWNNINGKRGLGWDTNTYVWVIEFKKVSQ